MVNDADFTHLPVIVDSDPANPRVEITLTEDLTPRRKRFNGIPAKRVTSEGIPLPLLTAGELRRGIAGCTVGVEVAWQDSALDDARIMLHRINQLAGELARRAGETPDGEPEVADPMAGGDAGAEADSEREADLRGAGDQP